MRKGRQGEILVGVALLLAAGAFLIGRQRRRQVVGLLRKPFAGDYTPITVADGSIHIRWNEHSFKPVHGSEKKHFVQEENGVAHMIECNHCTSGGTHILDGEDWSIRLNDGTMFVQSSEPSRFDINLSEDGGRNPHLLMLPTHNLTSAELKFGDTVKDTYESKNGHLRFTIWYKTT